MARLEPSPPTESGESGLVLVVGAAARRGPLVAAVEMMGATAVEADDAYAAAVALCGRPGAFRAVALSLHGVHREELRFIETVRRVAGQAQVWAADLDGRAAALAEAMRYGVDALLVEDGLHPIGGSEARRPAPTADAPAPAGGPPARPAAADAAPAVAVNGSVQGVAEYLDRRAADDRHKAEDDGGHHGAGWPEPTRAVPRGRPVDRFGSPARNGGGSNGVAARPGPVAVLPAAADREPDEHELHDLDPSPDEPVLTAEELRALLQDQPDGSAL